MKKKLLILDRDGTIISEPKSDFQIDSMEKFFFEKDVIVALRDICQSCNYELILFTNQDGLGTSSFPEENFRLPQKIMLDTLESQGIFFSNILIDVSFEEEQKNTRKPQTALLIDYLQGEYDLENSFVVGDRITDIQLAANIGAKGILYGEKIIPADLSSACVLKSKDWRTIANCIINQDARICVERKTKETDIRLELSLNSAENSSVNSGLSFFDHMLEQLVSHGNMGLTLSCRGDLNVDEHHSIEDVAIVLGEAVYRAYQSKKRFNRYAFYLPMDDCKAKVLMDLGGRPAFKWKVKFKRERIGDVPTEMFGHFFKSFSDHAKCNLQIKASGKNEHHKIESVFKAFARTLKQALSTGENVFPSSKGSL